jgi:hypothetical protein
VNVTLSDYIGGEQSVVINSQVNDRIAELGRWGKGPDVEDMTDDERDELDVLVAFRDNLEREFNTHFDNLTIVPENGLAEFLRYYFEASGDVSQHIAAYVDWEKFAADNGGDFTPVVFNGDERYLVRGY